MTQAGIEPATFRFVAQHLNHCATAVPTRFNHTGFLVGSVVGEVFLGQVFRKFSFLSSQYKSTNASNSFIYHPGDEQWAH